MTSKSKRIILVAAAILVVALSLTVVFSEILASNTVNTKVARIACMGDSITEITGYPEDLQILFGNSSVVGNFGISGATVNLRSNQPYYYENAYINARNFLPTTVIIMLGTNDARTDNYAKIVNFTANYDRVINRTRTARWNSTQQIILVVPPPLFDNNLDLNGTFFAEEVVPRIHQVAIDMKVPLIDVYIPLKDLPEYFPDGVHPNPDVAKLIAKIIYDAIK
jgi:lysophospholipase L1-like esterase